MQHISSWKTRQIVFGQALQEITKLFSARSLTFMPIKGAFLIISGLASSINDRQMRDIDLLIPEDSFDETCDWFASLDTVTESPRYWSFERTFIYTMGTVPVYCELHSLINTPARFLLPNKTLFSRGVQNEQPFILPDPTDALLIHICHMLVHIIDGFNKQAFREIDLYASQPDFSWDTFRVRAKETGIIKFICLILATSKTLGYCSDVSFSPCKSWYVALLLRTGFFISLRNRLLRKILFEIPFVRNVANLTHHKMTTKYSMWY